MFVRASLAEHLSGKDDSCEEPSWAVGIKQHRELLALFIEARGGVDCTRVVCCSATMATSSLEQSRKELAGRLKFV